MDTSFSVTIHMSDDSVQTLAAAGFRLCGFRAVKGPPGALPVLWFLGDDYSETTSVEWTDVYEAYTSHTAFTPGTSTNVATPGGAQASTGTESGAAASTSAGPGTGTQTSTGTSKPADHPASTQAGASTNTKVATPAGTQASTGTGTSTTAGTPASTQDGTGTSTDSGTPAGTQGSTGTGTTADAPAGAQGSTGTSTTADASASTQASTGTSTTGGTPAGTQADTGTSTEPGTPPGTQGSTGTSTESGTSPSTQAETGTSTTPDTPAGAQGSTVTSTTADTRTSAGTNPGTGTGTVIELAHSYPVQLGQALQVTGADLSGEVVEVGGTPGVVTIINTTPAPFTCGISLLQSGGGSIPICAFPMLPNGDDLIVPLDTVFLMFSPLPEQEGELVERSFSAGLLIDMTDAPSRSVTYDALTGVWSWAGTAAWATPYPPNQELAPLLVLPLA